MWFPSPAWILQRLRSVDGADSGLDADMVDGLEAAAFALVGHVHPGSAGGVYMHLTPEVAVLGPNAAPTIRVIEGVNIVWQELVFANSEFLSCFFNFPLPTAFGSGANTVVKLYWKAEATDGYVRWAIQHRSNPAASWDGVMSAEIVQDILAPTSVGDLTVTNFILPEWPVGPEMVNLRIIRRGADSEDTLNGSVLLLGVEIEEA